MSCEFTVWSPPAESVSLVLVAPVERTLPMEKDGEGYWRTVAAGVGPGADYSFRINEEKVRPDPASFSQPRGVHETSRVVDHSSFQWNDREWRGIPVREMIMYELHTGTFTPEGTFDGIIPRLDDLKGLGINAIEIMPVAQFPGERNWGYDGACPFAVQNSYGGPEGLKRFVNACHLKGIAVVLDVVYNHLGPEGNYLRDYGPYFTDRYVTPWGEAINFDGAWSNGVRNYFIENALFWFHFYHVDALRLDAIHGIFDMSATHFLRELARRVREESLGAGRPWCLIAESDLNNSVVVQTEKEGGYGLDAMWCDDFHHSLHVLLTEEYDGYYCDFGDIGHLEKSFREGQVYSGQYSLFRKRNHGNSTKDIPADRFVVFSQNHDQVGNRMKGDRISSLVSMGALKLAAGIILLSPYIPLLFMGEEYGEQAPFLYFVDHGDQRLIDGVREGRKKEFQAFGWEEEPPDPYSVDTFMKSKLNWSLRHDGDHGTMLRLYRDLIALRKKIPPLAFPDKQAQDVVSSKEKDMLLVRRWKDDDQVLMIFHFGRQDRPLPPDIPAGPWIKLLDSAETEWGGTGSLLPERIDVGQELFMRGESFAVYINRSSE